MDKKPFKKTDKSGKSTDSKRGMKNAAFIALLVLFGLIIYSTTADKSSSLTDASFSDVVKRANNGEIKKIEISGSELKITKQNEDKPSEKSRKEDGSSIYG